MRHRQWPFKPDHITNDGPQRPGTPLVLLTGTGILSNEHLQGIQTSICANLENPTTIIEFSPKGHPVRTDSQLINFALHPPCARFRACTDQRFCYACDNEHAQLFYGLQRDNLGSEILARVQGNESIQNTQADPDVLYNFVVDSKRVYLEYDCRLLGYRELIFPIFFGERVIAVFFVGELCLDSKLDFIRRKQAEFFESHPDCFDGYLQRHSGQTAESIRQDVFDKHEAWVANPSHVLDPEKYDRLVSRVDKELTDLERTLHDQTELARERYVRRNIQEQIYHFHSDLPSGQNPNHDDLESMWQNLQCRLEDLVDIFALRYAIVFGTRQFTHTPASLLEAVAHAGDLPVGLVSRIGELVYDVGVVLQDDRKSPVTSDEEPILFTGLRDQAAELDPETHRIRLYPVPLFPQGSTVVLVGYYPWNAVSSPENQRDGYLDTAIQSFYIVVLSTLSSILAAMSRQNLESTLRVFGHETGQLTAGLNWLSMLYFSQPGKLKELSDKKVDDIGRDIQGYLQQLYYLTQMASLAVEVVREPERSRFLAFRELLYKWRDFYRLEARVKSIEFALPHVEHDDPYRPEVYGDQRLLEQLVYNLVNNAVKYCYRGTRIHMDCRKLELEPDCPHTLTITNFGIDIEKDEKLYTIYTRGANAETFPGLGIGLHIAKQIVAAHEGKITHSCEKVSDFNVPLIEPFLQSHHGMQSLRATLQHELQKLRENGQYENVLALHADGTRKYRSIAPLVIIRELMRPTWKVSFTVTIPAAKGEEQG